MLRLNFKALIFPIKRAAKLKLSTVLCFMQTGFPPFRTNTPKYAIIICCAPRSSQFQPAEIVLSAITLLSFLIFELGNLPLYISSTSKTRAKKAPSPAPPLAGNSRGLVTAKMLWADVSDRILVFVVQLVSTNHVFVEIAPEPQTANDKSTVGRP